MKLCRSFSVFLAVCALPQSVGGQSTSTMVPPETTTSNSTNTTDTNSTTTTTDAPVSTTEAPLTTLFPPGLACQVCINQCAQCGGSGTASCRTVCEISQEPTAICDSRCTETLHLGEWVGSNNPSNLPANCECKALCATCGDSQLADCLTVCDIAADEETCEAKCAETFHLGEWQPDDLSASAPTCVCTSLCTQCDGSMTADCQTVCDIAANPDTCGAVCAETLHLGEYYAAASDTQGGGGDGTNMTSGGNDGWSKIGSMVAVATTIIGTAGMV